MYKLVSKIEGTKWSLLNGIKIIEGDILLLDKNDLHLYSLIDKDGKKIDLNKNSLLVKIN